MNHVIALATAKFKLDINSTHGLPHWQRVEQRGVEIALNNGGNIHVIKHFAYLHDACRKDEDDDPDHGNRGFSWVCDLWYTKRLTLFKNEFDLLAYAIMRHNHGATSTDPTIGACWDADRLDLIRCKVMPAERFMSTAYGKQLTRDIYDLA